MAASCRAEGPRNLQRRSAPASARRRSDLADLRVQLSGLTSGGCRRESQGEGSQHNARVEQALRAAGFDGEAKREAPRPGGGAGQRASVVTARAPIARQGEKENARQPETIALWHSDAKQAKWGGGSRNAKERPPEGGLSRITSCQ